MRRRRISGKRTEEKICVHSALGVGDVFEDEDKVMVVLTVVWDGAKVDEAVREEDDDDGVMRKGERRERCREEKA